MSNIAFHKVSAIENFWKTDQSTFEIVNTNEMTGYRMENPKKEKDTISLW